MQKWFAILCLAPVLVSPAFADSAMDQCVLSHLATSDDTTTVGEIRQICISQLNVQQQDQADQQAGAEIPAEIDTRFRDQVDVTLNDDAETLETTDGSALSRRLALELSQANNPFSFLPHRPNYFIFSNNLASTNEAPFDASDPDNDFQPWESKFQISLKLPVVRGLFNGRADAFVAYTNRSFWQMFNSDSSAPFRDSNHEPEAWLSFKNNTEFMGFKNSLINVGINHSSNGQGGELSRSWNRVFAEFIIEKGNFYTGIRPWYRVLESRSDDNPDIERFMGHFDITSVYKYGEHSFDLMLRNNLRSDNKGAVQLGWSFPLYKNFRGYVQWFNGYGESLIDYDYHTNSVGFGIQFSDWL